MIDDTAVYGKDEAIWLIKGNMLSISFCLQKGLVWPENNTIALGEGKPELTISAEVGGQGMNNYGIVHILWFTERM